MARPVLVDRRLDALLTLALLQPCGDRVLGVASAEAKAYCPTPIPRRRIKKT